jgi:hypothetical protein
MAGTLPSFCVHHISAHIQAIFQNTNWTKFLFLSVFLLFSLLRSVKHPGPPYQDHSRQRRKFAALQTSKAQSLLATPILSFLLKTLVNYKTSPWIQSLHTQKSLIKKNSTKTQARNV